MSKLTNLFIFLTLLYSLPSFAVDNSKLPLLNTKQDISNIRFISKDGKFTYYQRGSGDLLVSTNYKVEKILSGKEGTQYEMIGSPARKFLIVSQNEEFHTFYGIRLIPKLYKIEFGTSSARELGSGQWPALHQDDTWMSTFDPNKRQLQFINLKTPTLTFFIKLYNSANPYFRPQVVMPDGNTILYTDLNKDGVVGVLKFELSTKKISPLYKADASDQKIELCYNSGYLFVGQFGKISSKVGSTISVMRSDKIDFGKRDIIYDSSLNDIGNIVCEYDNKKIFFSKASDKSSNDIYSLEVATKSLTKLTDLGFATQILNMDGKLLVPSRGGYYVIFGEDNLANIDRLPKENKNDKNKKEEKK